MAKRITGAGAAAAGRKPVRVRKAPADLMGEDPLSAEARVLDQAGMADVVLPGGDPKDQDEKLFGREWVVKVYDMLNPENEGSNVVSINGRTKSFRYQAETVMREAHIKVLESCVIEHERRVSMGGTGRMASDRNYMLMINKGWKLQERANGTFLVRNQRKFLVERVRPVREVIGVNKDQLAAAANG